jgi:hypothetical protein
VVVSLFKTVVVVVQIWEYFDDLQLLHFDYLKYFDVEIDVDYFEFETVMAIITMAVADD